jgi:hypothetical protein
MVTPLSIFFLILLGIGVVRTGCPDGPVKCIADQYWAIPFAPSFEFEVWKAAMIRAFYMFDRLLWVLAVVCFAGALHFWWQIQRFKARRGKEALFAYSLGHVDYSYKIDEFREDNTGWEDDRPAGSYESPRVRYRYAAKVAGEIKAHLGCPSVSAANTAIIRDRAREIMRKHGTRMSHISHLIPVVTAMVYTPTEADIFLAEALESEHRQDKLRAARMGGATRSWRSWLTGSPGGNQSE